MGTRANRLLIARFALALMLFVQAAMAWSGCDWPERALDRAVLEAANTMPCHDADKGAACVAHCQSERQFVHKVSFAVPAMPPTPVLTLALFAENVPDIEVAQVPVSTFAIGPPRRILLQSLQL